MNETVSYSRAAFLDTWSAHDWRHGVQVETLMDLTELTVVTENSTYELTIISASSGEILVRGGRFFPEFTPARLAGSSMGGSFLKIRGIYVGFNLEFHADGRAIVTSRVRSIVSGF
jgi:hypothetical protein